MHFVTGIIEIVNSENAFGNRGRAHVDHSGDRLRHEAEANTRLALRIKAEHLTIDEFSRKTRLGIAQITEERNKITYVVTDQRIHAAIAVLADVVDPVFG